MSQRYPCGERESDDEALRRATFHAAAATEDEGGPFLSHLLGLHSVPARSPQRRRLRLSPDPVLPLCPSILTIAILADIASGAVLGSQFGTGARMATVTLTIHVPGSDAIRVPALSAEARVVSITESEAAASSVVVGPGRTRIGFAQSSFLHLPRPSEIPFRVGPWEKGPPRNTRPPEKSLPQWAHVAADDVIRSSHATTPACLWDALAGLDPGEWRETGQGCFRGSMDNGMTRRNRFNHTQGGVLFAAATLAANWAIAGAPTQTWTLMNGHLRYLRPGTASRLPVSAEILRSGSAASDVLVRIGEAGQEVAVGLIVLGSGADRPGPARENSVQSGLR